MRSVTQFLEDLRDGREVYVYGERVEDVTTHPVTAIGAKTAQVDYEISEDPACADFALATLPTGERISRYYAPPRSAADLIHRRRLIEEGARRCLGFPPFAKEGGTDALNAAAVAAKQIDKQRGTDYYARVERYRGFLALHDYSLAVAMTDVKGDRSLRPAQQPNPDVYVHIVEERPDGIVLRGAKAHITAAPFCNELLVIPTRALTAEDTAYAVCCGVPANAPGVRMIVRDPVSAGKDPTEYPVSGKYEILEAIVIFDNVFVPYERVFMQGEWEFAGLLAASFANYHRFTAAAYKYPYVELLVGAAHLMAETNGVDGVSHIRDKIAMLTMYAETISALSLAAVEHPKIGPDTGMAYPNPVLSNAVKFYFADHYHEAIKALQDIAGGIIVTAPSTRDFLSDQTRPDLQRFLTGKEGVSVEDRWRIIKLVRDLVASDLSGLWEVTTLHAEGSLAAQRLATVRASDVQRYRAVASHAAGLD